MSDPVINLQSLEIPSSGSVNGSISQGTPPYDDPFIKPPVPTGASISGNTPFTVVTDDVPEGTVLIIRTKDANGRPASAALTVTNP